MDGPTWQEVTLAAVNVVQVIGLAYLGIQQARSTRERIRRVALDEHERHNGSSAP
jgi:hypothetical protein